MIKFPNAKINLGLNITERRTDGYHNIETLFYPIEICDSLEFVVKNEGETTFTIEGLAIEGNTNNNLILKAYSLLKANYELPALDIVLLKNIPMGAGLGGGSADAAFMLAMLNDEFELGIQNKKLQEYAAQLGADCAFFLLNKPTIAAGIGNIFSPCEVDLNGKTLLLIKPEIHVSTADAYRNCKPAKWSVALDKIVKMPITEWRGKLKNDFEDTVFIAHPKLGEIKELLYKNSAEYAAMSGSGSTIYGLLPNSINLNDFNQQIAEILNNIEFKSYQLILQ